MSYVRSCEEENCAICVEPLISDCKPVVVLVCSHQYHFTCFTRLVHQSTGESILCPLCRREYPLDEILGSPDSELEDNNEDNDSNSDTVHVHLAPDSPANANFDIERIGSAYINSDNSEYNGSDVDTPHAAIPLHSDHPLYSLWQFNFSDHRDTPATDGDSEDRDADSDLDVSLYHNMGTDS